MQLPQVLDDYRARYADPSLAASAFDPLAQSAVLLQLLDAWPRPLRLDPLISYGLPDCGISKNDTHMALFALQACRLIRFRRQGFISLTRHGLETLPHVARYHYTQH